MRYLCMIYIDEGELGAMPRARLAEVEQQCLTHTSELVSAGQLVAAERLASVKTATTVRARNDQLSVTDGPFAETREQLAGFYLIDARDLNEAIRIAGRIPPGQFGCIEIRPVMDSTAETLPEGAAVTGARP